MAAAITVDGLRKAYGQRTAVDGVSFEVAQGEVFGLIGPNGAGKTTTVECLQGMRRADDGAIRVLGLDPWRQGRALRARIGTQLQEANLPDHLRVGEAVELFAALYPRAVDQTVLLERVGIAGKRTEFYDKLSGGQKQRLLIALALVHDPELVFLDELTTGLDPQARKMVWELVKEIRARGTTVLLTTHLMEEAERLCDRVAIMDGGRIVALDRPSRLVADLGGGQRGISFEPDGPFDEAPLAELSGVTSVERLDGRVVVRGDAEGLAGVVVGVLERERQPFRDLRSLQPTLEDVFIARTGRRAVSQEERERDAG